MPPPVPNQAPAGHPGYPAGGAHSYPSAPVAGQDKSPPPPYSQQPASPSKSQHACIRLPVFLTVNKIILFGGTCFMIPYICYYLLLLFNFCFSEFNQQLLLVHVCDS